MAAFNDSDIYYMQQALDLAERAKGKTFPNPAVGAIVVSSGRIAGRGATDRCGGDHAEKCALSQAGSLARGGVMYTTLEPCCHFGRTPPCTSAIVDAGIARVFVAVKDPNPLVNGKGIQQLRARKIDVSVGLLKEKAAELYEDFFWSITRRLPWISLKLALTLDGKIADTHGDSQWITNEKARTVVHDLRRRHAAVAVGSTTLKKDNPRLTVRLVKGVSPVRMVFASNKNIGGNLLFRKEAKALRSIIVISGGKKQKRMVEKDGVELWYTGADKNPEHLMSFMDMAFQSGLTSILIEGGRKLASSFLENRFVNRLYIFYGNKIVGKGLDCLDFSKGMSIQKSIHLREIKTNYFEDNFMVTGIPVWE